MELMTCLIGGAFAALCASPFVLAHNNGLKQKKKILEKLTKLASENNCTISSHEFTNHCCISIDSVNNVLFFDRETNGNHQSSIVALNDVRYWQKLVEHKHGSHGDIARLAIALTPKNGDDIVLEFYVSEQDMYLSGEFVVMEKWFEIIKPKH